MGAACVVRAAGVCPGCSGPALGFILIPDCLCTAVDLLFSDHFNVSTLSHFIWQQSCKQKPVSRQVNCLILPNS